MRGLRIENARLAQKKPEPKEFTETQAEARPQVEADPEEAVLTGRTTTKPKRPYPAG